MSMDSQRWAQRQYGWGIAFAIALALLMLWWLFFQRPAWLTSDAGTISGGWSLPQPSDPVGPSGPGGPGGPGAPDTVAVAAAQATLDAAALSPVGNMGDVRAAAQTVVAATSVAAGPVGTPVPGTDSSTPGGATPGGSAPAATRTWWQTMIASLPALTALVTFAGLVVTSLMKWRTDLHETGRRRRELELQQHELALERHQYELERMRTAFELERQKMDFELARKKLELRALEDKAAALNRQIAGE